MIRNENGINFDVGYPLSDDDFHLLYVDINKDQHQRFLDWIKDVKAAPLIICGQIGTGKTTFIEKGFFEIDNQKSPFDIKFSFDTDTLFHFEGEYWGLFLGKIIDLADRLKVDISSFKLAEDILGIGCSDNDLKEQLLRETISILEIKKQKDVFKKVGNLVAELIPLIKKIILRIEDKNGRKLFIYAEGIDKFKYNETAYPFLQGILDFMADYKTLYEVNFVHLFFGNKWRMSDAIILHNAGKKEVEAVLQKRLGDRYKDFYSGIIPAIAGMSEVLKKTADQAFSYACSLTRNNSLFIAREKFPSDIIKAVYRDRYLLTEMITGEQRDSVHDALYNKWIMITGESKDKKQWKSMINPLITPASDIITDLPESPEAMLLKQWAKEHEISPFGLEIDKSISEEQIIDLKTEITATATLSKTRIFDIIDSESCGLNPFNIIDLFERLAAYFLEEKRKDKIIIAYDDPEIAEIANDFIIGKAATYKPVECKDIFLKNPTAENILTQIRNNEEKYTALSIFFGNALSDKDALTLNKLRDRFIQNRMIWWIRFDHLRSYLEKWTQLQQFFLIYRLDENLLAWITKDEVLEDLEEIDDSDSDEMKNRLKKVLHYLEGKKNG
ncbi:MAG: hypothetical protein JRI62_09940 [Deltaproteobacteria bacterium]|nr:hypothetical protein [Deltaproteobacteria bacterium]